MKSLRVILEMSPKTVLLGNWCFSSEKHRTASSGSVISSVCEARRFRKLALNLFGTSFLVLLLSIACGREPSSQRAQPSEDLRVERKDFSTRLAMSGKVVAKHSATITGPSGAYGVSIKWIAKSGSSVKKGDTVLELDASAIVARLEALEAALEDAESAVAEQHNTAKTNHADKQHLLKQAVIVLKQAKIRAAVRADAYPTRTYEDLQLALGRAKVAHRDAVERLALATKIDKSRLEQKIIRVDKSKRELSEIRKKLDSYRLRAPRDGIVIRQKSREGNREVRAGDKTSPWRSIIEMPELSSLMLEANLSDVDEGRLYPDMKIRARLDAYPGRILRGQVVSISPVAQQVSRESLRRVFRVRTSLNTSAPETIRPGMSARIIASGPISEHVLVASRRALTMDSEGARALMADGSDRKIVLGSCDPQECVVTLGLVENERLRARDSQ